MYNLGKRFFRKERAEKFVAELETAGYKPEFSAEHDRVNKCTVWFVRWN